MEIKNVKLKVPPVIGCGRWDVIAFSEVATSSPVETLPSHWYDKTTPPDVILSEWQKKYPSAIAREVVWLEWSMCSPMAGERKPRYSRLITARYEVPLCGLEPH